MAGVLLLAVLLWVGPSSAAEKSDRAPRIFATALSILAGILLAVITLLGDPRRLHPSSWRVASAHRRQIRRALNRLAMLFWLCLGVIALALATAMIDAHEAIGLDTRWVSWVKHVALSLGIVALPWSFSLPSTIRRAQLALLDREAERRKEHGQVQKEEASTTEATD